ncbi:MAG: metallophosphoesterase, partial [Clostridiales bacterium]|nr:metallophosphoesterase [Clostridiales bacterium]
MAKRALKRHLTFKTILKVTLIVIVSMVGLGALGSLVSYIGFNASMKLAKSLAKVEKTEVLEPIVDEGTGVVTFRTDRDFKVLQLTDTHIGAGFASIKKDAWAINAIAEMVSYTKPDLVIVTGDMVYPVPFQSGTINNLNATKLFAATMESLGVY